MTTKQSANLIIDRWSETGLELIASMSRYELDDLMESIVIRRNEIMADSLRRAGFGVRIRKDIPDQETYAAYTIHFRYLCVYPPNESDYPGEWATLDECQRLLDTVCNLKPADAFNRWCTKIAPLQDEPYTKAEAFRDMTADRQRIKQELREGKIDLEMANIELRQTSDYLGYAQ